MFEANWKKAIKQTCIERNVVPCNRASGRLSLTCETFQAPIVTKASCARRLRQPRIKTEGLSRGCKADFDKPHYSPRFQGLLEARFASDTFLCEIHAPLSYKVVPPSESLRYHRPLLRSVFATLSLSVPLGVFVLSQTSSPIKNS